MAGKRRNYAPIWARVRYLLAIGNIELPLKLWWRSTEFYAELASIDEDNSPRLHVPSGVLERWKKIDWEAVRLRTTNWAVVTTRVDAVNNNPDGNHSPNTLATGVFGPLANPQRNVHAYNFAEEFAFDGATVKSIFPELCSKGETVAAEMRSKVLLFRRSLIDSLKANDKFRIRTPYGCFVMTRLEFETVFANVATNETNYINNGSYSYPRPPQKTFQFLDFDEVAFQDNERVAIADLLERLLEHDLLSDAETDVLDIPDGVHEPIDEDDADPIVALPDEVDARYEARNVILFGPPGTGKSFRLQNNFLAGIGVKPADHDRVFRVTFHPETSYFDFVGSYKPLLGMEPAEKCTIALDGREMRLADQSPARPLVYYGFEPGPFTSSLLSALREPNRNVALIIEEINRGNCSAIFGDLFQLLDRDAEHRSQYAIRPSAPLATFLTTELRQSVTQIAFPPNFFIYATMNTSDQSLFPMDTAFKRRWTMEYVGIVFDDPAVQKVLVPIAEEILQPWWAVATVLNQRIVSGTGVDDKQMGPYFVRQELKDQVTAGSFRSKVLFYLWNDVFRGNTKAVFDTSIDSYDALVARHRERKNVFAKDVLDQIASLTVEAAAK